jgi:hypothetical protein
MSSYRREDGTERSTAHGLETSGSPSGVGHDKTTTELLRLKCGNAGSNWTESGRNASTVWRNDGELNEEPAECACKKNYNLKAGWNEVWKDWLRKHNNLNTESSHWTCVEEKKEEY